MVPALPVVDIFPGSFAYRSSGVHPNITFELDGIDYYTTGNVLYTGK